MSDATREVVRTLVLCALPWISPVTQAVVDAVLARRGRLGGDSNAFARELGYRNRHHLAYQLKGDGLIPLRELAAWIRVLGWVREWEVSGTALCRMALESGADSSVFYDTDQGVTGMPSSEASEAGCAFLVLRLREQCAPPPKARGRARRRALAAGGPLGR